MKQLLNEFDFTWYKKKLDADAQHEHLHIGQPTHYPCRVSSSLTDDWGLTIHRGPNEYHHEFIYQQTKVCPCCGHVTTTWDQPVGENEG